MFKLSRRCAQVSVKVGGVPSKKTGQGPVRVIKTNRSALTGKPEERQGVVMLYNHSMRSKVQAWSTYGALSSFFLSSAGIAGTMFMDIGVFNASMFCWATVTTMVATQLLTSSCLSRILIDPARGRLIIRKHQIFTGWS